MISWVFVFLILYFTYLDSNFYFILFNYVLIVYYFLLSIHYKFPYFHLLSVEVYFIDFRCFFSLIISIYNSIFLQHFLAVFHKFQYVLLFTPFISKYFLICLVTLHPIHWLFSNVFFNFHIFYFLINPYVIYFYSNPL